MLEALHSNLLTVSPVGGTGRCAPASHPDIPFIPFESSLHSLIHYTFQYSPCYSTSFYLWPCHSPLRWDWVLGREKEKGGRVGRSSQIIPYIISPKEADYFSCIHEARKQRFMMAIIPSASTLPGVTFGLSSKLSHRSWMANCEMSKTVLGKLL